MHTRSLPFIRLAICAAAFLVCACQDVPKYKRSNGLFDEWSSYEGKHFSPSNGTIKAIDPVANTVTIVNGKNTTVYPITSDTRIIHEGTDIPLAQLPLNQSVKYVLTEDGKSLISIWYGTKTFEYNRPGSLARQRAQVL